MEEKPNETKTDVSQPPQIRDRVRRPEGAVPKQAQAYVIAGLSLVIVLAVMFSKNHAQPPAKPSAAHPAVVIDGNERKIQDFGNELTEQQRATERARLERQLNAQVASLQPNATAIPQYPSSQTGGLQPGYTQYPPQSASPVEKPKDPIAEHERQLTYNARFASNLAFTTEREAKYATSTSPTAPNPASSLVGSVTSSPAAPISSAITQAQAALSAPGEKRPPEANTNSAHGQPYVLFEGTMLESALVNRLDGDFSGPVKVMVTNPVYSHDRQHVLVPEGTVVLGETAKIEGLGQRRLAVRFHRMIMPDGYSVDLDRFSGLNQIGETGLKDEINHHYVQIFGASIALGIIAGAAESSASNNSNGTTGTDGLKAGIASSLSQSGLSVVDRFLNIPPTITIREGHRVRIYFTQDLLLPAYENHTVPPNI